MFFEVPNVLYTLHALGIWDIIYEHCSYFSTPALTRLFQETGFTVLQVYPAFDGQYLCLEAIPAAEDVLGGMEVPEELGQMLGDIVAFGENYRNKVQTWNERLSHLFTAGNCVVVWGAGSKGVTFLNTIENGERVHCVADVNPHKQGRYVAGTGQKVVSSEETARLHPDTILVMNPIYKDEIWTKMSDSVLMRSSWLSRPCNRVTSMVSPPFSPMYSQLAITVTGDRQEQPPNEYHAVVLYKGVPL